MPNFAELWPQLMLCAGMGILCWILMRRGPHTWSRTRTGDADSPPAQQPSVSAEIKRRKFEFEDAVMRWEVRMHDLSRDAQGELETKIRVLQQLIRMASEQEQRLSDLLDRCQAIPPVTPSGTPVPSVQIPDMRQVAHSERHS